jgi:hypothetical protein
VSYATANGTAIGGTHYAPASGTLTFAPGEVSRTFTVASIDNTVVDGDRTVSLRLSNPAGGVLGAPATAALSNFTSEAVGFDVVLDFQGSFPITPGRRYLLGLDVDDTGGAVLWQLDEGPLP